jgi:hypothetical protein
MNKEEQYISCILAGDSARVEMPFKYIKAEGTKSVDA